jgi:hypothetical protein
MATTKSATAQIKVNGAMVPVVAALTQLNALPDSAMLTTSETAVFLRLSVASLERMRRDQIGPPYVAGAGGGASKNSVAYMKGDLKAWLVANQTGIPIAKGVQPTAKPPAGPVALAARKAALAPAAPAAKSAKKK